MSRIDISYGGQWYSIGDRTLAEVQDQCVELAVDAGELHAENTALRARLAEAERERDRWRAEAERRLTG